MDRGYPQFSMLISTTNCFSACNIETLHGSRPGYKAKFRYAKPIQVFPGDLLEPTYTDPEHCGRLLARSEEERRRQYIEQLDYQLPKSKEKYHPFVQLVKRCLQNKPPDRPTAEEVITALEEMKADIEGPYGEVVRADAVRQVVMMRALKKRETEVRKKTDESAAKDEEIHQLQQELEHEQVAIVRMIVIYY